MALSLATGWLPSQVENEDYATMMAVIERLQAQHNAQEERKSAAELQRWKQQRGYR